MFVSGQLGSGCVWAVFAPDSLALDVSGRYLCLVGSLSPDTYLHTCLDGGYVRTGFVSKRVLMVFISGRVWMGVCLWTCPDGSLSPDVSRWEFVSGRALMGVRLQMYLGSVYVQMGVCFSTCLSGVCLWTVFVSDISGRCLFLGGIYRKWISENILFLFSLLFYAEYF